MDNKLKQILRKNRVIIWIYRLFKTIAVFPLKFTSFKVLQLSNFPLKDLFNPKKTSLLKTVVPYTKAGYPRLSNVYNLAKEIEEKKIVGSFVECGTWKGGCSAIMGAIANRYGTQRKTWYLDSFEGMPEPSEKDGSDTDEIAGDVLLASQKDVEELVFDKLKLPRENNIIVKGWFENTIPQIKDKIGSIAILRMDADWYEATKFCLEQLYDKVVQGGYVIFDDYGRWQGCKQAVDEFFKARDNHPRFQYIGNYGARVMYFKKV